MLISTNLYAAFAQKEQRGGKFMKDTTIDEILKQRSIYPECERKTYEERKQELTYWKETYGEILWAYNLYGMDRKE